MMLSKPLIYNKQSNVTDNCSSSCSENSSGGDSGISLTEFLEKVTKKTSITTKENNIISNEENIPKTYSKEVLEAMDSFKDIFSNLSFRLRKTSSIPKALHGPLHIVDRTIRATTSTTSFLSIDSDYVEELKQLMGGEVANTKIIRLLKLFRLRDRADSSWDDYNHQLNEFIQKVNQSIKPIQSYNSIKNSNKIRNGHLQSNISMQTLSLHFDTICHWTPDLRSALQSLDEVRRQWVADENNYRHKLTPYDTTDQCETCYVHNEPSLRKMCKKIGKLLDARCAYGDKDTIRRVAKNWRIRPLEEIVDISIGTNTTGNQVEVNCVDDEFRWRGYWKSLQYTLRNILKCQHFIDVYLPDGIELEVALKQSQVLPEQELRSNQARIILMKKKVMHIFEDIASENMFHSQWPQLEECDEDGNVDLEGILCSICGKDDEEGNDILVCDKLGCYRAYHDGCVQPDTKRYINAVTTTKRQSRLCSELDEGDHWFCPLCRFMEDCMMLTLELLDGYVNEDASNWWELFDDLNLNETNLTQSFEKQELGGDLTFGQEEESDEDDDYAPSIGENVNAEDDNTLESSVDGSLDNGESNNGKESKQLCDNIDIMQEDEDLHSTESDQNSDDDDDSINSCDTGDDIENDELQGLLNDAENDCLDLPAGLADSLSLQLNTTEDQTISQLTFKSGRPRRRCTLNTTATMQQKDSKFIISGDESDVGKIVARVYRGCVENGTILKVKNQSNEGLEDEDGIVGDNLSLLWQVEFESGAILKMDHKQINTAMELYEECEVKLEKEDQENEAATNKKQAVESMGVINEENIINTKRRRKDLDYQMLYQEMYGHLESESDSSVNSRRKRKKVDLKSKKKKKKRNKKKDESVMNQDMVETNVLVNDDHLQGNDEDTKRSN